MGLRWNMGAGVAEGMLNVSRLNKWTDKIVPIQGTTQRLSGAVAQVTNQLSGNVLYVVVSKQAMFIASSGSTFSSTVATDQYWPANEPMYHVAKEGESDFISVIEVDGGTIDCFISVGEHTSE